MEMERCSTCKKYYNPACSDVHHIQIEKTIATNRQLSRYLQTMGQFIAGHLEFGECFYDEEALVDFLQDVDKLKEAAIRYYVSNRKREDEQDGT